MAEERLWEEAVDAMHGGVPTKKVGAGCLPVRQAEGSETMSETAVHEIINEQGSCQHGRIKCATNKFGCDCVNFEDQCDTMIPRWG